MKTKTKVIFRAFDSDGEIIALFPEIPADTQLGHCMSYMHVGQHCGASVDLSPYTRPATPEEYAPLAEELTRIGYDLQICKRITAAMSRARLANISKL